MPHFAYIDVINPLYPRAEGPDEVVTRWSGDRIHPPRERLRAADDRGFPPLRIGRPGAAPGRGHDVRQVPFGGLMDRVLVRSAEPFGKDVEYGQKQIGIRWSLAGNAARPLAVASGSWRPRFIPFLGDFRECPPSCEVASDGCGGRPFAGALTISRQ
jgi:hypothetical protein